MGNPDVLTDLTIGGIIDDWGPETVASPQPAAASNNGNASATSAQSHNNPARAA
jgi:hypothetical protein